jgi:hypothetical protein
MPGYKNYYQFSERLLEQLSLNAKTLCQIAPIGTGLIMPLSIKALVPLGRATMLASVVIVASGILEITGCPLFAAVGKVTLNWAAVRSETEKLRQKITTATYQARIASQPQSLSMQPWTLPRSRAQIPVETQAACVERAEMLFPKPIS